MKEEYKLWELSGISFFCKNKSENYHSFVDVIVQMQWKCGIFVCKKLHDKKNKSVNSEFLTFWHNLQWIYLNISEFLIVYLHVPFITCRNGDCHLELSSLCDQNTYRYNCCCIKVYWLFSYFNTVYSFLKI